MVRTVITSRTWVLPGSDGSRRSKVLQPMVKAAQELQRALHCRKRCETLKRSFPSPEAAPEAVGRMNKLVADYGEHIQAGSKEHRALEAEFVSRSFRFPDKVIKELDDSVFAIVFQDGTSRMMPLVELMVFTFNLITIEYQYTEVARRAPDQRLAPLLCRRDYTA